MPFLGLAQSLLVMTGISLVFGIVVLSWLVRGHLLALRVTVMLVALGLWLAIPWVTGTRLPADYLQHGKTRLAYEEGLTENLALLLDGLRSDRLLADDLFSYGPVQQPEIDGLWQGDNRKSHQIMAAHVPMMLHPRPQSVLVVGLGAGQTASRITMYNIDRLACVEIEPRIFSFVRKYFDLRWMNDNRLRLLSQDGRNYIKHSREAFDVISLEVGQIFRPGVALF